MLLIDTSKALFRLHDFFLSVTTVTVSDYAILTEGAMSVNKQRLANGVFCPVLSSEKPKKERKSDDGHKSGLHEEDGMDCQRELR